MELQAKIELLQTKFSALRREGDIRFASSLCQQFWSRRRLSPKQVEWVDILLERANRPQITPASAPAAPAHTVGNYTGIKALFDRASEHLKRPAIVLLTDREVVALDKMIRITPAPANSRNPGSLYITRFEKMLNGKRPYYGQMKPNGAFHPIDDLPAEQVEKITEALRLLASDPARTAAEHGRLTGRCCFCNIPLEDERSTSVGYGPVCADHFGLPWGDRPVEFAATPVARPRRRRAVAQVDDKGGGQ
jgi:hypothetical protein